MKNATKHMMLPNIMGQDGICNSTEVYELDDEENLITILSDRLQGGKDDDAE
jgi:hypothetical protein